MIAREQKQTKKGTGIVGSLLLHAFLLLLLFLVLSEKKAVTFLPSPRKEAERTQMTVPAPVVFYGNQVMMNNPTPVSGHKDGKSAFEHTPSSLPTPPAPTIAPERSPVPEVRGTDEKTQITPPPALQQISTPEPEIHQEVEKTPVAPTLEAPLNPTQAGLALVAHTQAPAKREETSQYDRATPRKKQHVDQERKLTLADLFKNSREIISTFAQDGLPSAKKAGTEGGDDQGSGRQITIKEGDMKYYTLWAKFLNHLNASARFSRRGKERLFEQWIRSGQIQYVMQCGITVDRQGNVIDIDLVVSSGCREFDAQCFYDIKAAVPYPPLPESLGKKSARFEVSVYP